MIEYLNPNAVANTIRLVKGFGGSEVALVEDSSDINLVRGAIGGNIYLISAHTSTNFVEIVRILHNQNWQILFTSANDLIYSTREKSGVFGNPPKHYPTSEIELTPTLIALTSSSAPPSWLSELHGQTESGFISDSPMNRQLQDWSTRNARRVSLIRKKYKQGLTLGEQEELSTLRTALRKQLNADHQISFKSLDDIDRYLDNSERRSQKR